MARTTYRRKASFAPEIVELVSYYLERIGPVGDATQSRAWKNIEAMQRDGITLAELRQAVENYAAFCQAVDREPRYRIHAGNFFGPVRATVMEFLPDTYEPPPAPIAATDTAGESLA